MVLNLSQSDCSSLVNLGTNAASIEMQNGQAADDLLHVCRRLWGQPYVAPIYALLLSQWLLTHPDAGGKEQRQKHVNVLISGTPVLLPHIMTALFCAAS